ncbi:KTSC domain-containing protein [Kribbella sp. HUAS MG21]|uniref:KTSC domain-containing protein n=1 Tax=Kribbella sp. HUAS MG21 TaxID=3160966 RepID=A0AAU7T5J9_9ACTN
MRRRPVNSSSVRSVGWSDGTLELEYVNGDIYQYFDVPQPTYAALLAAPSIGAYVNKDIKPYYDFREV